MPPFHPEGPCPHSLSKPWTGAILRRARPAALLLGAIGGIGTAFGAGAAGAPAEPGALAGPASDPARPASLRLRPAPLPSLGFPSLSVPRSDAAPGLDAAREIGGTAGVPLFLAAGATRPPIQGLVQQLMRRLQHEAGRYRAETVLDPALASDPLDSHFEEQRAREAERIVSRAFRRTLEVPIEQRARGTFNLGGLVDLAGSWSGPRSGSPLADAAGPGPREAVELKLDAHPKLVLRATFLGFRGRVEVPILDDPLRVVFERPLGACGSATLTGGTSRDGRDWATLNFSLRF